MNVHSWHCQKVLLNSLLKVKKWFLNWAYLNYDRIYILDYNLESLYLTNTGTLHEFREDSSLEYYKLITVYIFMRSWRPKKVQINSKMSRKYFYSKTQFHFIYTDLALSPLNLKKVVTLELFYYSAPENSP